VDLATLEAARGGDRLARGRLLDELQHVWFRFCLGLLRDEHLAADATQETGLRFLRQLTQFRGESELKTWSLGIALNVVRETRRKRPVPVDAMSDSVAEHPAEALEADEMKSQLRLALKDLSDRQREAVVLRFFEELSVDETAAAMGCAAGTIKATVHQALRILKTKLRTNT
jgi:RNA polymerase sigma-70 factor, ECF subfamily